MGWIYTFKPKGKSIRDFFKEEMEQDTDKVKDTIMESAVVNLREFYAAFQREYKGTGRVEVWALVCIIEYPKDPRYNFGYKDMDETMGPYYHNCPRKVLDLLSPTDSEHAASWRNKCEENLRQKESRPKYKAGDILNFKEPLTFNRGRVFANFKVISKKPLRFAAYNRDSDLAFAPTVVIRKATLQNADYTVAKGSEKHGGVITAV